MNASIVDLRYKSAEILKALERRQPVNVLYHGKIKGVLAPYKNKSSLVVQKHPFFDMLNDVKLSKKKSKLSKKQKVDEMMDDLRGGRNRDF
ncbi:MAG: type II toxin-antitoxin system Phd/YefM family antitoxin [Deltaproteobacteria bacterium]|nr:type II toxin-antitoxin system Phd/YefM family antitoxin [Deltaproteobacteria bacterium]